MRRPEGTLVPDGELATITFRRTYPHTQQHVWDAIATGPGVTSWFVPTDMREDGTIVSEFGPGMESVALVTDWDPPRRFAAESDGFDPNGPPLVTEWCVEATSAGGW